VHTVAGAQRIVHRCQRAAAAGVRPAMTLTHARALLTETDIHVEPFDEARERKALHALASWALRFSPIVATDPPDGLLLDIAGCQRLFHGERRLVNLIANNIHWLGFHARIALADTFACARAAARFGDHERTIIPSGDEREAFTPLPIEALRVDDDILDALHEVGVDCIGDLFDLPRLELVTRFGPDLLLRLDQATGEAIETIEPIRPVQTPRAERAFAGPVKQLQAITLTTRDLLAQLIESLTRNESGVTTLHLTLQRSDAGPVHETITLSRPTRRADHLWSLLRPKLETVNLGFGVERITLTAARYRRLRHRQTDHWRAGGRRDGDAMPPDHAHGEFIDVLSDRVGPERAVRIEPVQSYIPESAFHHRSVMHPARRSRAGDEAEDVTPGERPSMLFDPPEPIEIMALTPDGPPRWIRWRGAEQAIIAAIGPERVADQWWEEGRHEGTKARRHEGKNNGHQAKNGSHVQHADVPRSDRMAARRGTAIGPPSPRRSVAPSLSIPSSLCASVPSSLPVLSCLSSTRDYFKIQNDSGRWLWIYRALETSRWFVHGQWV